jgi:hypothetical protein
MLGRFNMAANSNSATSSLTPAPVAQLAPRPYRHKLRTLAYVNVGSTAAILRDLSLSGLAIQAATKMSVGEQIELRLDLPNPRCRLEAVGRVVWTDSTAQAGVEFVTLSARAQSLLSQWIFSQLLTDVSRIAGEGELLFSTAARPAIRLEQTRVLPSFLPAEEDSSRLPLLGFVVSPARFARIVDSLVLLCSVLLFSLISLFLIDILPAWPFTLAFLFAATVLFGVLYWLVFGIWFGTTPGSRLAALAGASVGAGRGVHPMPRPRFR